jgi:hypothetical protein
MRRATEACSAALRCAVLKCQDPPSAALLLVCFCDDCDLTTYPHLANDFDVSDAESCQLAD